MGLWPFEGTRRKDLKIDQPLNAWQFWAEDKALHELQIPACAVQAQHWTDDPSFWARGAATAAAVVAAVVAVVAVAAVAVARWICWMCHLEDLAHELTVWIAGCGNTPTTWKVGGAEWSFHHQESVLEEGPVPMMGARPLEPCRTTDADDCMANGPRLGKSLG